MHDMHRIPANHVNNCLALSDIEAQHIPHPQQKDVTRGTDQDKLRSTPPYPKQAHNGYQVTKPYPGALQMSGLNPHTHSNVHYVPGTPTSQPPYPAAHSVRLTPHWEPPMTAGAATPGAGDIAAVVWKTQGTGNGAMVSNPFR